MKVKDILMVTEAIEMSYRNHTMSSVEARRILEQWNNTEVYFK